MNNINLLAQVELNEEGFLINFDQWSRAIAECIAKDCCVDLTDAHWEVIEYLQTKYKNHEPLSIRGIKKSGVVNIKDFYKLFPNGPLKTSTKIAGIPKPKSCI